MNVVFILWNHFSGFRDALACAKARSGCPVHVISDQPKPEGVNYIPISEFPEGERVRQLIEPNAGRWASYSLARWFILREFAEKNPALFPIFCPDWDVMIFRDLKTAYAPFNEFDYTMSKMAGGNESAAYGVNHMPPLELFCSEIERLNKDGDPAAKGLNDMTAWIRVARVGNLKAGNLFEIRNDSVFDHSMECGEERFVFREEAKDVVFVNGFPFFVLKDGGGLTAANTLHCWGSYKSRTEEMRTYAGIPL